MSDWKWSKSLKIDYVDEAVKEFEYGLSNTIADTFFNAN
jgi:hypothetical protein